MTDISRNSKPIVQLVTCPICLEIFREPLQLPCQHTFCKSCLERITEDRWGRCPICRGCFRVPYAGIASFEVNRTIVNLLESLLQTESRPMIQAKCALCKLDDTIAVCEHCGEAICYKCRRQHYDEIYKNICLKLNEIKYETEKLISKEMQNIKKHEDNIHHSNEITKTIHTKVSELITKIKFEEKKLLDTLEQFQNNEQKFINDKTIRLQDLKKMNKFCLMSEEQLNNKNETDQEVIDMRQTCDDYFININELRNQILVIKTPKSRISFFDRDISFDAISLGFIEIGAELEPIESTIQLSSIKTDTFNNNKESFDEHKINSFGTNSKRTARIIGKRGRKNTEFIHPSSLSYSKQNQSIYVCDTYNNRLVTYGNDGIVRHVYTSENENGEKYFHNPYSIHIDSNNRIYLIDQSERRIKVFDDYLKLIRIIGQYGRENSQYTAPCDLCTDEDNSIFVCDAGTHRILKYNEQGHYLLSWGGLGSEDGQFKCPACICLLNNKRLAVSDWGNDRIQIFSTDGCHLLTIGKRGQLLGEFSRPLGIAYDTKTDRLFVCDGDNNRVMIFTHDFTLVELVHSKFGFHGPYDVLILDDGRIVISEYRAHRLQII